MKVSFDFDGTLSRKDVQNFAKGLVESGYDVWIVTSRIATEPALVKGWHWVERQNQELYDVAERVGIKIDNIIFTEFVDKIEFLKDKDFIFHIDDDVDELIAILNSKDTCKTVNVDHFEWLETCKKILQENLAN
jgi:hypothetical protein